MKTHYKILTVILTLLFSGLLYQSTLAQELTPPPYLLSTVEGNSVDLSWGMDGDNGDWISHFETPSDFAMPLATFGTVHFAHRWSAEMLEPFVGETVSKIAFVPRSDMAITNYTLKIWSGEDAQNLVYSQEAEGLFYSGWQNYWNEVILDEPLTIEPNQEYWFGFERELTQFNNEYSCGRSEEPGLAGYGDMFNWGDGWFSLTEYGPATDYNLLIQVFLEGDKSLNYKGQRAELLGFNLYKDGNLVNDELLTSSVYTDADLEPGEYTYEVKAVYDEGESSGKSTSIIIGGPTFELDESEFNESLNAGESVTYEITVSNNGQATLNWSAVPQSVPLWINIFPLSGIVEPGETMTFDFTIDATYLSETIFEPHQAVVNFSSNTLDPNPSIAVTVEVFGSTILAREPDTVDFGNTPLQSTKVVGWKLTNINTEPVTIWSAVNTYPEIFDIPYLSSTQIQPGESFMMYPSFTPTQTIEYTGLIYISVYSSNWGFGNLALNMKGKGAPGKPVNLTADVDETTVTLNWLPPGATPGEMTQGTGQYWGSIYTYGEETWEYAQRFSESDLSQYAGSQLDAVSFFALDDNASYTVRVYAGEQGNELLAEVEATDVGVFEWTDVTLPEPIFIDMYQDIYLAVEFTTNDFGEFIANDAGPVVLGKGDLYKDSNGDWAQMSDWYYNFNWNIRGLVSEIDVPEDLSSNQPGQQVLKGSNNFGLMGFNIYRDGELINQQFATDLDYSEEIVLGDTIVYGVSAVYDYGEGDPVTVPVFVPLPVNLPSGWEYNNTVMAHNIHIHNDLMQYGLNLQEGDLIGAFYADGVELKCAGAGMWNGENMVITIYGDDPVSPEKEGFEPGENIQWKAFIDQGTVETDLAVEYSEEMPQYDGTFAMLGLSMLESITATTVSVNDIIANNRVITYPNPSTGEFTFAIETGSEQPVDVQIYNNLGVLVYQNTMFDGTSNISINLSEFPKGIYQLIAKQGQSQMVEKVMLK